MKTHVFRGNQVCEAVCGEPVGGDPYASGGSAGSN